MAHPGAVARDGNGGTGSNYLRRGICQDNSIRDWLIPLNSDLACVPGIMKNNESDAMTFRKSISEILAESPQAHSHDAHLAENLNLIDGEIPGVRQTIGVAVVLFGAYLLEIEEARTGFFAPLRVLLRRPGVLLAIGASALWGITTVLEKLSIDHMSPPSGPVVALLGTFFMVLLLTPGALRPSGKVGKK